MKTDNDDIEGSPEITIEYKLKKSPGKYKIELISKDSDYYYLMKNGKFSNFLVSKKMINKKSGFVEKFSDLDKFIKKNK